MSQSPSENSGKVSLWLDEADKLPTLSDELIAVLWASCHLVQETKTLALASPSFLAISWAMSALSDLDFQTCSLRSGLKLGLVSPLNLEGFM